MAFAPGSFRRYVGTVLGGYYDGRRIDSTTTTVTLLVPSPVEFSVIAENEIPASSPGPTVGRRRSSRKAGSGPPMRASNPSRRYLHQPPATRPAHHPNPHPRHVHPHAHQRHPHRPRRPHPARRNRRTVVAFVAAGRPHGPVVAGCSTLCRVL